MAADTVSREDSGTDLKMSQEIFGCTTSEYLLKGLEEYLSSALEDALEEADEEEIVSFEAIENALDKADGITGIGYWAKIEWSQNKDPVQYLQFGDKKKHI